MLERLHRAGPGAVHEVALFRLRLRMGPVRCVQFLLEVREDLDQLTRGEWSHRISTILKG